MALAFAQLAAANGSTTNQSTAYAGNAGTPIANDILVCWVMCSGNATVGTLSGGGWTWNLLTSFTKTAGADIISVWYALATAATSTTPSYLPSAAATGCIISCVRVTGQEGTNVPYIRQIAQNAGSTANPTVVFGAAPLTGNGILAFATNATNSTAQWTAPTSFTEISEVAYNTPANSTETVSRATGQTVATLTWTNAQVTAWVTYAIEFYTAGTGPTDPNNFGFNSAGFFGGINTL
jgi:hypothetical protein